MEIVFVGAVVWILIRALYVVLSPPEKHEDRTLGPNESFTDVPPKPKKDLSWGELLLYLFILAMAFVFMTSLK